MAPAHSRVASPTRGPGKFEGAHLKGSQLDIIGAKFHHFAHHTHHSGMLMIGYRKNKKGVFSLVACPVPVMGADRKLPWCWDLHLFFATRDASVIPFVAFHTLGRIDFELSHPRVEMTANGCTLYYLHARYLRGTKAELGERSYRMSYGMRSMSMAHSAMQAELGSFIVQPIPHNATSNPGQIDADHVMSAPASYIVLPGPESALAKHEQGFSNLSAELRGVFDDFGEWYEPRQYGPTDLRTEIPVQCIGVTQIPLSFSLAALPTPVAALQEVTVKKEATKRRLKAKPPCESNSENQTIGIKMPRLKAERKPRAQPKHSVPARAFELSALEPFSAAELVDSLFRPYQAEFAAGEAVEVEVLNQGNLFSFNFGEEALEAQPANIASPDPYLAPNEQLSDLVADALLSALVDGPLPVADDMCSYLASMPHLADTIHSLPDKSDQLGTVASPPFVMPEGSLESWAEQYSFNCFDGMTSSESGVFTSIW